MKANLRKRINNQLYKVPSYNAAMPLDSMFAILRANGFEPICEDGTPFSAIFCGHNGSTSIQLREVATGTTQKECLQLQWWGDREHGRKGQIETNCYVM